MQNRDIIVTAWKRTGGERVMSSDGVTQVRIPPSRAADEMFRRSFNRAQGRSRASQLSTRRSAGSPKRLNTTLKMRETVARPLLRNRYGDRLALVVDVLARFAPPRSQPRRVTQSGCR